MDKDFFSMALMPQVERLATASDTVFIFSIALMPPVERLATASDTVFIFGTA